MTLTIGADPVPLNVDETGTVRVGGTRVTLDTVISVYQQGYTPEGIVRGFPPLKLADVHAVISYYLNHREEVEAYLRQREVAAEALRGEIESRSDPRAFRERLLARWAQRADGPR